MECCLHNIEFDYLCPVCETESKFLGMEPIFLESFRAGYNGLPQLVIHYNQIYIEGMLVRKYV